MSEFDSAIQIAINMLRQRGYSKQQILKGLKRATEMVKKLEF